MKNLITALVCLITSPAVFAAVPSYDYSCSCYAGDCDAYATTKLTVEGNKIQITFKGDDTVYHGKWDSSYKPSGNKEFYRYNLTDWNDEYRPEILVHNSMEKGGMKMKNRKLGGWMKFQARGEGYFWGNYVCYRK